MSIFASRTIKTIPIPFDEPHTVTVQKLPGRHMRRAQQENQFKSVDDLKRMGGVAFQKELAALSDGDTAKRDELVKKAQADPLNGYDRYVVLTHGIKSWTYLETDETTPKPVTSETIDDLDDEAADFLAREILKLSKPSLFQTAEEVETAQKND